MNNDASNFRWDVYKDGYTGSGRTLNRSVNVRSSKDKVYSHEEYAQSLYDAYMGAPYQCAPKDDITGSVHDVVDIRPVGPDSVAVDTAGGGTSIIDMTKEKEYVKMVGAESPESFVEMIRVPEYRKTILANRPVIKVVKGGKHSLWGGHIARMEEEFMSEIRKPTTAYYADITGSNNGGYIVMVNGIKCFMPGSMAAPGVISDFDSMIGKTVPVMIVNHVKNAGFVVSYKRYLTKILPSMVEAELEPGMTIVGRITGFSTNGIFVQFPNKAGEPVFSGLMHRDEMSPAYERLFNEKVMTVGGEIDAVIHSINIDGERVRVVLGDTQEDDPEFVAKKNRMRRARARRQ